MLARRDLVQTMISLRKTTFRLCSWHQLPHILLGFLPRNSSVYLILLYQRIRQQRLMRRVSAAYLLRGVIINPIYSHRCRGPAHRSTGPANTHNSLSRNVISCRSHYESRCNHLGAQFHCATIRTFISTTGAPTPLANTDAYLCINANATATAPPADAIRITRGPDSDRLLGLYTD